MMDEQEVEPTEEQIDVAYAAHWASGGDVPMRERMRAALKAVLSA